MNPPCWTLWCNNVNLNITILLVDNLCPNAFWLVTNLVMFKFQAKKSSTNKQNAKGYMKNGEHFNNQSQATCMQCTLRIFKPNFFNFLVPTFTTVAFGNHYCTNLSVIDIPSNTTWWTHNCNMLDKWGFILFVSLVIKIAFSHYLV